MARIGRIHEDRHASGSGNRFLEHLQLLADDVDADAEGHPSDVPARTREAGDESDLDRIGDADHDDGDCRGCILGGKGRGCRHCHDEVHLEPNQFRCKVGQPIEPALRKSEVDHDVLTLDPAQFAKSFPECADQDSGGNGARAPREKTYPARVL